MSAAKPNALTALHLASYVPLADDLSVSTLPPSIPPIQPSAISPELQQMLAFISAENERHRAYFSSLFERTAKVLGMIVFVTGGIAV